MKKKWIYGGILVFILALGIFAFKNSRNTTKNEPQITTTNTVMVPPAPPVPTVPLLHYIEITDSCNWEFVGTCVNVRSEPTTNSNVVLRLRDGMVFQVEPATIAADGHDWYKVIFEKNIRYPERITSSWYIAADSDSVLPFTDVGEVDLDPNAKITTSKRIVVDLSQQMLYAYDGNTLFMQESVSTGQELTPTAVGTFQIYKKTPSRYMQGPLPGVSDEYYDLPGTAWDMYFTVDGAVLHAAYWHNNFGHPMSHGCVNQPPENAKKLYAWAPLGTPVIVQQ